MVTLISHSPEETMSLAEQWAGEAKPGWVFGLTGPLGAGKTLLAAGLARGLGVPGRVTSPTFSLLNEYRGGRLPLFHLDLYRIESIDQIISAGLETYLVRPPGIAVIEWIERWIESAPAVFLRHVRIDPVAENDRRIVYEDFVH